MPNTKKRILFNTLIATGLYFLVFQLLIFTEDEILRFRIVNMSWIGIIALAYMRLLPAPALMAICLIWLITVSATIGG